MIILKNATLLDGTGTPPLTGISVVIRGSRIEAVIQGDMTVGAERYAENAMLDIEPGLATDFAAGDTQQPDSVGSHHASAGDIETVIDMNGSFLMPGLIDAHVHFGGSDAFDRPGIGNLHETYDYLQARIEALKWGVTTVRSAGDYTPDIFEFRDMVKNDIYISPRIIAAGKMIQARNGHPIKTVFGDDQKIAKGATVQVDDNTDLALEVKNLIDAGADWIKAVISEVDKLDYPTPVPRIPPEKVSRIVTLAHEHGKPCMIHVDNISQLREALSAGADSIEHILAVGATDTEIDDDLINMLSNARTFIVPTLFSIKRHESPDSGLPLVYEKLKKLVGKLIASGIKIGVGTDSSIPFVSMGESVHNELFELTACGMSPLEAITAATSGNASLLSLGSCIGAIKPGYFADLIALGGDPLVNISNTKTIQLVIANGRIVTYNN